MFSLFLSYDMPKLMMQLHEIEYRLIQLSSSALDKSPAQEWRNCSR